MNEWKGERKVQFLVEGAQFLSCRGGMEALRARQKPWRQRSRSNP